MGMFARRPKSVEILSARAKIPADGRSETTLCLRFSETPGAEVQLRLTRGSFSAEQQVREQSFPVVNGEVNLAIYSPRRPGAGFLSGPGFKHRLEFSAASFAAGLFYEWLPTLVYALAFALILRTYAVASFYIPSGSMEPTLKVHDLLIADKLSYKLLGRDPQRGDIMIFQYPRDRKTDYIKRVIGLPGDVIKVQDGTVYVNGQALSEDYIADRPYSDYGPETVPAGHYFMMGDNRNHSSDSRVWGFVPRSYFEGRALFVFWPPQHMRAMLKP